MKNFTLVKNIFLTLFFILAFHNKGFSQCTTGQVQEITTNSYAASVLQFNRVTNQNNALGAPDNTSAIISASNNTYSFLELSMSTVIRSGMPVTVNGSTTGSVDIYVYSNTSNSYRLVGENVSLNFTFISPTDWQRIIILNNSSSRNVLINYIDAQTSGARCLPDTDKDGVADSADLDDDNDGVADIVENVCAASTLIWANHYVVGTNSSSGQRPSVDAASPPLSFNGVTLAIAPVVTSNITSQNYRVNNEYTAAGYTLFQNSIVGGVSTHTFTFSRAVNNLSFTLFDIDTGPNFTDEAQFIITTTGGATYTMSAADYTLGAKQHT